MQGEHWILNDDSNRQALMNHLRSLDLSKPKAVKIEDKLPTRTQLQNRYLWGWIYASIESQQEAGGIVIQCDDGREVPYTKEILHEIFKRKFLVIGVIEAKGKSLELYRSTTELKTIEFCEFVRKVEQFVYQFWKITIPQPVGQQLKQWQEWAEEAREAA
jgi:hypothetical protein